MTKARRRVDALSARCAALHGEFDEAPVTAAIRRFYARRASWADRELMAGEVVDADRLELMRELPRHVARRARFGINVAVDDPKIAIEAILSHPPDEGLPAELRAMAHRIDSTWQNAVSLTDDVKWSYLRMLLGVDPGRPQSRVACVDG